jgi:tellurite resistance protein
MRCRSTFEPSVLDAKVQEGFVETKKAIEQGLERFRDQAERTIRGVLIQMSASDGKIEADEITKIQGLYGRLFGRSITAEEIRKEQSWGWADRAAALSNVRKIAPTLNEKGKVAVLSAAWTVAATDGQVGPKEEKFLLRLGAALGLRKDETWEILGKAAAQ